MTRQTIQNINHLTSKQLLTILIPIMLGIQIPLNEYAQHKHPISKCFICSVGSLNVLGDLKSSLMYST